MPGVLETSGVHWYDAKTQGAAAQLDISHWVSRDSNQSSTTMIKPENLTLPLILCVSR